MVITCHVIALYSPGTIGSGPVGLPHLDKVTHLALFAAPTFLLRRLTNAWWPIMAMVIHGPLSETIQHYWIPNRAGDPFDVAADVAGVGLGLWLAHRVQQDESLVTT